MSNKVTNSKWFKAIVIIAIIIIPLLYSGFYLKAFWDPYGNLEGIPVAIVNKDKGNDSENLGKELTDKLLENATMKFTVIDEEEAQDGLVNKEYYATITIPEDFTEKLNSGDSENKQTATITYSPNQKSSYLASQIINKVVEKVQKEVTQEVNEKVVNTLSDKLAEVPNKMEDISSAITEVQDGTGTLNNGLKDLKDGTSNLSSSYTEFDNGVSSAYDGSKTLSSGMNDLNSGLNEIASGSSTLAESVASLDELQGAVTKLSTGSEQLNTGVQNYVSGVTALNGNVTKLLDGIIGYVEANQTLLQDANIKQIYGTAKAIKQSGSIEKLNTSGSQLTGSVKTLNTGIQTLSSKASGLAELKGGVAKLNSAIQQARSGSQKLVNGSQDLQNGLKQLQENSGRVVEGIASLDEGATKLVNGGNELSDGLSTFKTEVEDGITDAKQELTKLDGLSEFVKEPVEINEVDHGEVSSYGVAFAPYFMSISLWVGSLMSFVVFYYDYDKRFKLLGKGAKNKYLRNLCYIGIAVAQAVVMAFALKLILGFSVTNIWLYYTTCILVSLVFVAMIQLLITQLGDIGKFLAIVLLVLQLAASGGTFPIETEPSFFQAINPYMPMTYTIGLFREAIISRDAGLIAPNVYALLGIFACFLAVTIVLQILKKGREKAEEFRNKKAMEEAQKIVEKNDKK